MEESRGKKDKEPWAQRCSDPAGTAVDMVGTQRKYLQPSTVLG